MHHDDVEDARPTGLAAARHALHAADRVVIFTGAGVSAESGVPTFRGAGGLWREFRAEDLATPEAFARDPRLVWEWYGWRRELVARCVPNAAHRAIAAFAAARADAASTSGVRIVTQNVDGLHQRAERELAAERAMPSPDAVLTLHGTLFGVRCTHCDARSPHTAPIDATSRATLPTCASCGSLLRPDVVWFGEALDPAILDAAFDAARHADVCLVVGTSALVQPAASIATLAARAGATLVEINAEATPLSALADVSLRGAAGALVPALLGEA
ncbi:MAG: NAD-dependent deacylase [Gemmatirosa sp.]|nr:NAD-dependent deacylase [Gemmatirosa sp.]